MALYNPFANTVQNHNNIIIVIHDFNRILLGGREHCTIVTIKTF